MRALVLIVALSGCVIGEDQNNCLPISCTGCCSLGGVCQPGTSDQFCGSGAKLCTDCRTNGLVCNASTQSCSSNACPVGQCKGTSGACRGCSVGACTTSPSGECDFGNDGVFCCGAGTAPCATGQCNTGNGTLTPCCPTTLPCASGTSCFSRTSAPSGAKCCR